MSDLEMALQFQVKALRLPDPCREYRPALDRRWRVDFAWPDHSLIVEVEGGSFVGGRHTRGAGFEADCEKYNLLTLAGWSVLRVTGKQIESGVAAAWIERALSDVR